MSKTRSTFAPPPYYPKVLDQIDFKRDQDCFTGTVTEVLADGRFRVDDENGDSRFYDPEDHQHVTCRKTTHQDGEWDWVVAILPALITIVPSYSVEPGSWTMTAKIARKHAARIVGCAAEVEA